MCGCAVGCVVGGVSVSVWLVVAVVLDEPANTVMVTRALVGSVGGGEVTVLRVLKVLQEVQVMQVPKVHKVIREILEQETQVLKVLMVPRVPQVVVTTQILKSLGL